MTNQINLSKGELMEELIRNYFLNSGFYVLRGVKYKYEGNDITDIDLYLYNRSSSISSQRVNVDIKNKKTPQAFERILWANGLRELLNFDSCIVATTDSRSVIHKFGHMHNTIILDGLFISKLNRNSYPYRLTEEEITNKFSQHQSYKSFSNKNWRFIYEESKSKLLTEQDFSGFNSELIYLQYFLEKIITDPQSKEDATRLSYLIISHLLIIFDFIINDITFLSITDRELKISDGFKYGNLGKVGIDKIFTIAEQISGNNSSNEFIKLLESIPTDILIEYFSKFENITNLFNLAKRFEHFGFHRDFFNPENIDIPLKGFIYLLLDYFGIERKNFFESF